MKRRGRSVGGERGRGEEGRREKDDNSKATSLVYSLI
jgi:hypothetical protein